MNIWMTILVGVVAALIGGLVWEAIFPDNDGIAWIGSIIVGIVLVWLYATMVGRGRTTASVDRFVVGPTVVLGRRQSPKGRDPVLRLSFLSGHDALGRVVCRRGEATC